jgi:two-component system, cell cycle sensor histidine kinase and response regulator CckA
MCYILDLTVVGELGGIKTLKRPIEIDADVKAIAFSGNSHHPVMSDYTARGFKGVLLKPFEPDELIDEINRVLFE